MNSKIVSMLRLAVLSFALSAFLTPVVRAQVEVDYDATMKLERAVELITTQYVDPLQEDQLVRDAIEGMLHELDPHSVYIPAEDLKAVKEDLQGHFEGVGIQFNILEDTILVVWPIPDGPSERLGIQAGDQIVFIEGENVGGTGITNDEVIKRLRGPKGTRVSIKIKRRGEPELLEYKIVRDKIPLYSIDAAYMATPEIGYIRLSRFSRESANEFREHLAKLQLQGMKDLVLDLRNNHGGYLDIAIDLADEFLGNDMMIVYTEGVHSPKREYAATSRGSFEKGKLAVLIDDGSASASEIVSGAVQDWDRGLVIGRRSYGKGLVQREYALPDGSAMRLTVARYYTPTGRSIQRPYDEGVEAYRDEISERYRRGEFMHPDSIRFPDSLKYYTPNKRLVYGGGGIMPDIFIALDTSGNSDYFRDLLRKGTFNDFALAYTNANRSTLLAAYEDAGVFAQKFDVRPLMEDFVSKGEAMGVPYDQLGMEQSRQFIEFRVKALIARNLWTTSAYYQVINDLDPVFHSAIDAIEGETFKEMGVAYK
jgi:carboxyl-terminal processing protease